MTQSTKSLNAVSGIEMISINLSMSDQRRFKWNSAVKTLRNELFLQQAEELTAKVMELAKSLINEHVTDDDIVAILSDKSPDKKDAVNVLLNVQENAQKEIPLEDPNYISEAHRKHNEYIKTLHPREAVCQYDMEGKFIAEYPTMRKAEEATGASHNGIANNCKGKQHSCAGFIWKYKSDETPVNPRIVKLTKYPIVLRQYDANHKFIREHKSIVAAARYLSISQATLRLYVDMNEMCLGYYWKTVKE